MKRILTYSEVETAKKFADEMSGVISDMVNTCADKGGEIFLSPEANDIAIVYLKKMTEFVDEKCRLSIARVKDDASYYTAETEEDKTGIETVFLKVGITNADVNSIISAYDIRLKAEKPMHSTKKSTAAERFCALNVLRNCSKSARPRK